MVDVDVDIIIALKDLSFSARNIDEKNAILKKGRPTPELPDILILIKGNIMIRNGWLVISK